MQKFVITFGLIFVLTTGHLMAQNSCCGAPDATLAFANLTNDAAFRAAHASPLPFVLENPKGKDISIPVSEGAAAHAWEIRPTNPSSNYLFVFHEWWGMNDYIKRECERLFTDLGDVNVIAIDLYDRKIADNADSAAAFMKAVSKDRAVNIIKGVLKYAGKEANIYTIGWCFGGGWSMQASLLAARQAKGCVLYYGMPEKEVSKLRILHAPVYGIFASKDQWINKDVVKDFESNMKKAGKDVTTKTYEAEHAFANPSNPNYDKEATADAYKRVLGFLKKLM